MTAADAAGQQQVAQLGRALLEAFNAADWTRFRSLLAPDVVYEETGTGRRLEGADAYITALEGWKRAIPDARGTLRHSTAGGDTVALEVVWKAPTAAPWTLPAAPSRPVASGCASRLPSPPPCRGTRSGRCGITWTC
jgi:SnoaL-like domain